LSGRESIQLSSRTYVRDLGFLAALEMTRLVKNASDSKRFSYEAREKSMSGGVLLYVDAEEIERNEVDESFSVAG